MKKEYSGVAYKQAISPNAPWIISFVAGANDLLEWVGIPRRTEKGLVGFQRLDNEEKVNRAKEYFMDPNNQSPTALILGIHQSDKEINKPVELIFDSSDDAGQNIRKCKLVINFDSESLSNEDIKNIIRSQIKSRLSQESKSVNGDDAEELDDPTDELDEDVDEDDDSKDKSGGEIELGRSLLSDLLNKLSDDTWFEDNKEALLDYAKPATLIDGQHRLKGADLTERGIPFTICALYDCAWSEQVFQFTIVNYTQNGIPDQFITANAALSLTGNELKTLTDRLTQAKVKVIEYDLMKVVNFDDASPFFKLINLGSGKDSSRIGYKAMVRVAKQWYSGKHAGVAPIIENIYPDLPGTKAQKRRAALQLWKDNDIWGEFFKAFWQEVKSHYETEPSHIKGHYLWEVGHSNLMIAAVLAQFQDTFMKNLAAQDEIFFKVDRGHDPVPELIRKCRDRCKQLLQSFPADFFGREWKQKSLDTGAGKTQLSEVFTEMREKKGRYGYANCSLITGRSN
jgi:hypothetical protein